MDLAFRFTAEMLRMLSGPLIWAAHFLFVYVFTALAYARGFHRLDFLGAGAVTWAVALATLAAAAGILAFILPAWGKLRHAGGNGTARFLDWMTVAFGALSLLAVLWVAVPVVLVPAGAPGRMAEGLGAEAGAVSLR
jgi:hypothetical protein